MGFVCVCLCVCAEVWLCLAECVRVFRFRLFVCGGVCVSVLLCVFHECETSLCVYVTLRNRQQMTPTTKATQYDATMANSNNNRNGNSNSEGQTSWLGCWVVVRFVNGGGFAGRRGGPDPDRQAGKLRRGKCRHQTVQPVFKVERSTP